jgi:hypothetical protein
MRRIVDSWAIHDAVPLLRHLGAFGNNQAGRRTLGIIAGHQRRRNAIRLSSGTGHGSHDAFRSSTRGNTKGLYMTLRLSSRRLVLATILVCLLGLPTFVVAVQPHTKVDAQRWFASYKQARETLDASAAASQFAKDAEYQCDPFEAPLRGETQIRQYWEEVAKEQRDVNVEFEILSISDRTSIVRWHATFTRVASNQKVELEGIAQVFLNNNGKCVRFREWWNRKQI